MRASSSHNNLLRVLGLVFGVAVVVGGMVGQGILRTPGIVANAVRSPESIVVLWIVGAGLVAISAFAYVELGTAIPRAGGPYDFVRRAAGPLAGVIAGWGVWFVLVTLEAFLAIVVAEFLHRVGVLPGVGSSVLAVGVLALFWLVNWTGTRISGGSQVAFSALKGAALIALVILLFAQPTAQQPAVTPGVAIGLTGIVVAMRAIINTYDGWQEIVLFGEEVERPERTLPRAMATGILSVAVIYVLVNMALLHVLSPADMATSTLPAADAVKLALGPTGDLALTLFGVVSVGAITNLAVMKSARIAFALAREGHLPAKLSEVASAGTPRSALTVSSILAAAFAATGTYDTVVAMNVAMTVTLVVVVNLAAVRLRSTEPDLPRPFRIPLYPLPAIAAIALNLALLAALVFEDPVHSLGGIAILAVIGAVYATVHRIRGREQTPAA
jgi:basic amino acid/polyamine antiporter, APA family